MRRDPIKNPSFGGCGFCGRVPKKELDKKDGFFGGCTHKVIVTIDNFRYEVTMEDEYFTIEELEKRFGDKLDKCKFAGIVNLTPLHDEEYEYCKTTKKWYLVHQGNGYA
ncbi:hypothetical protein CLPU_50c00020 [Gottschalkia purinilytica]|uniref:Uncharacterized protein n=1 Tax=Gottschalkia purinilytica TaxID=1503 RepID=A0A0L0W624_GOTPU|nr:hypothetical protein [Gottschalkia purinilytica]KNF06951.1 hypothetical protein CLPU_50c00020 [Gottschalkia purinilytica]